MSIYVQYNLIGNGWSECIVEIDDRQAYLTASYLSDALANLLDAVATVVRGAEEATASFAEEPGEYQWQFKRLSHDRLYVRILCFADWCDRRPDRDGELILEAECRLRTFAGAVLSASQQVLATNGLEEYQQKWGYAFPFQLQAKLQKSLS